MVRENHSKSEPQSTEQFVAPAATVLEDENGYTLHVEMPGVNKEGLEM
jgi:HSP20 family molecular chaperone IbpA